jgi:hypothetical protein
MKKKVKWFLGHHEYTVFLIAVAVLVGMYYAGYIWEFDVIPPAKFVKLAFAVIATSIGAGCTWIWMNVIPDLKKQIDPDTFEKEDHYTDDKLSKWQKTKLAFWFYALYFFGFLWLVAF